MKILKINLLSIILILSACQKPRLQHQEQTKSIAYQKAIEFRELKRFDSAFLYFNRAKEFYIQQKDSLGTGKSLSNMAHILYNSSDYLGALDLSLAANEYYDHTKKEQYAYLQFNFNNMGLAAEHLADYRDAISFFTKSMQFVTDSSQALIVRNNMANVYRRNGNYEKSLAIYNYLMKQKADPKEFARVLSNQAYTKWLQNSAYGALPELVQALKIRSAENDVAGLNASYSHLADYYGSRDPDSATHYAELMYKMANQTRSPYDQLQALQKLIRTSPAEKAKKYFLRYQYLVDSVQISNNTSKNQFALIRYDAEKSKADNLFLQKENTQKKYQIVKREILFVATLLILIAATIIAILWYKKRRQKIELENQNAIRESQLRTSKKVHDVVANGLYRVMTEIENLPEIDKENLLDKIEYMYEKSRDISYDDPGTDHPGFAERVAGLVNSFASVKISIRLSGNTTGLWQNVGEATRGEIEHILQELMVNMAKHSHATKVTLEFSQQENQIFINYTDNGIGIKQLEYGNGLANTGNRIEVIQGKITFDTKSENGLKIMISFPAA